MSKWQVLKIAHTKKDNFVTKKFKMSFFVFFAIFTRFFVFCVFAFFLRKKSHVKMASFKNCPHQKKTILLQKKFKMSFFAIFCVFRDFYTFFVFLQFCCKKILNIFFRDFSRFSRFLRVFCVFAIFLWI